MNKIVLNIPHSSTANFHLGWTSYQSLFKEVKRLTDWHTDVLFNPYGVRGNIVPVVFPFSRFFVDVERMENDPMENVGQGILYVKAGGCTRVIEEKDRPELMRIYRQHRQKLADEITDKTLLVDCHSFSSSTDEDVDLCIGFNEDRTKPDGKVLDIIVEELSCRVPKSRIMFNRPYSNSITVDADREYSSVMIEVNKSLYMDENTLLPKCDWYKLHNALVGAFGRILKEP